MIKDHYIYWQSGDVHTRRYFAVEKYKIKSISDSEIGKKNLMTKEDAEFICRVANESFGKEVDELVEMGWIYKKLKDPYIIGTISA